MSSYSCIIRIIIIIQCYRHVYCDQGVLTPCCDHRISDILILYWRSFWEGEVKKVRWLGIYFLSMWLLCCHRLPSIQSNPLVESSSRLMISVLSRQFLMNQLIPVRQVILILLVSLWIQFGVHTNNRLSGFLLYWFSWHANTIWSANTNSK